MNIPSPLVLIRKLPEIRPLEIKVGKKITNTYNSSTRNVQAMEAYKRGYVQDPKCGCCANGLVELVAVVR